MKKKKNRQGGGGGAADDGGSNRRRTTTVVTNKRRHGSGSIERKRRWRLMLMVVCCAAAAAVVYLLYNNNNHRHLLHPINKKGWSWNRNDVTTIITYQQILTEHNNTTTSGSSNHRHFPNPVLAYVTPWNSKGYEAAKNFSSKLTHISPVWYHLQSQGPDYVLQGKHNVDQHWISDLRSKPTHHSPPLILPRIVLEAIPMDMLKNKKQRAKVIDLIIAECKEMDFDGIVLESWSRWAAYGVLHDPHMRNMALRFIKKLGQAMHGVIVKKLQLVYVIGPPRSDRRLQEYDFGPEDLQSLSDVVDGYSLMTYDFSNPEKPGPNAPLPWVHSTMQLLLGGTQTDGSKKLTHKIFLGINFYGNDFVLQGGGGGGGGPILGRDYLSLLEKHKPQLQWEKKSAEHFFLYYSADEDNQHVVFYPSLLSIAMRLDEARSWGAGISIWEIGQGLDYFFDLL